MNRSMRKRFLTHPHYTQAGWKNQEGFRHGKHEIDNAYRKRRKPRHTTTAVPSGAAACGPHFVCSAGSLSVSRDAYPAGHSMDAAPGSLPLFPQSSRSSARTARRKSAGMTKNGRMIFLYLFQYHSRPISEKQANRDAGITGRSGKTPEPSNTLPTSEAAPAISETAKAPWAAAPEQRPHKPCAAITRRNRNPDSTVNNGKPIQRRTTKTAKKGWAQEK